MRIGIDCRKIDDFGIGTYIRGLLQGLAEIGGDQYVAFVPRSSTGVVPASFERVVVDAPNYSIREQFAMRRAIGQSRLDVFHSPHYVLPMTSCPSVVTLHDVILFRFPPRNPLARAFVNVMNRRAVRQAARVLTVSEAVKRDVIEVLHCDPVKITVTPNGVSERFFGGGEAAKGRYFLFVGNDKPHKNVGRLVEAFVAVRQAAPDLELVIAGAPFDRFASVAGVRREGLVSDEGLTALYRGALALVMPSLEEGFGLPALEAMAAGTPVITSTAHALVEVTGDAALHVPVASPNELADAMRRILFDPALRHTLSTGGVERARTFTWRRCAEWTRLAYAEAEAAARHRS